MASRFLDDRQLRGLIRAGQVICPGGDGYPSFRDLGCVLHVDRVLAYAPAADVADLRLLLTVFALAPAFLIRLLMACATGNARFPGILGTQLRMLELGMKGTVMTLYYSGLAGAGYRGPGIHDLLGYDAKVEVGVAVSEPAPLQVPAPDTLTVEDAAAVFARARDGARELRGLSVAARLRFVTAIKREVLARRDEIVARIAAETGKAPTDALVSEVLGLLDHLQYLERSAGKLLADRKVSTPLTLMGKQSRIYVEPLGVVLVIAPWNYPFYQAILPISTALAAGDAVLFKPSEHTPLHGLVEEILAAAGVDPSWVQVVQGGGGTGSLLIAQGPDKVFFTGSARTGRRILAQAAELLIPVELELGGKDPMIVFADANLERAAAGAVWGALTNSGQSCTSVEFLHVQEAVLEPFLARLTAQVRALTVAARPGPATDLGAMTTAAQAAIVRAQLADAAAKGATILAGRELPEDPKLLAPVVVLGLRPDMRLWQEETFGPVLPVLAFQDEAEVVARANASPYGLSASVWTADKARAERVARALATGNVSINNVMLTEGNPALPFGGVRQSGFGKSKGEAGLLGFAQLKAVLVDADSGKIEGNWYPYTAEKYRLFDQLIAALFSRGPRAFLRFALAGIGLERHAGKAHRDRRG